MTEKRNPPTERRPATISLPDMPDRSGAWLGTREYILRRDAEFVRAHADYLVARGEQADAMHGLISARMRLGRLMAEMAALPEACRRIEEHKLRMLVLRNEAEATEAAIILAEARSRLSQSMKGAQASVPTGDGSLSIDEIEELLQALPEISPETMQTLSLMLKGRMKEKRG